MGEDLRGKELGVGISRRSDEFYVGRYTTKHGKRKQKLFRKLQECRQWLADSQYLRNYTERFERNINPVIGKLLLSEVKPIQCQLIMNRMADEGYRKALPKERGINSGSAEEICKRY